ncbi:MAG: MATE family efflux transporter [Lentisphaeria bacterium]|nr:MATE family efflux transporter [Lentisphaeria bacterium]
MVLNDIFHDKVFLKKLISLTLPITLQSFMLALVAAADALMLGKVEQNAMAAVSLATQIQFVQNMLLYAIIGGVGVLGAQYWGKKDTGVLEKIFGISIQESFIISLAFFIGCYFYPEYLMKLFAHDPTLIQLGSEYLKIASYSYLITGISQSYLAIMRVSEHAARSAWISSGTVVLNIILNYIFIFGCGQIPAMGIRGAALATTVSRVIELIWCVVSSYEKSFIKLHIKSIFAFDKILLLDFWKYVLPILSSCLLWGIGFTAYTAIMGHMGPDAAAANAIAAVARDLLCCLCNGVSGACGIIIGNELGAGNLNLGKSYGERAMVLSFIIGGAVSIIILAIIPIISHSIPLTQQAHEYMVGMFFILAVYMIGRCVCTVVINGVFSSGGDTLFDMYSLIVCMWGIALPCAFAGAFYFELPVLVIYGCTCLDEVGKVPWVMHHYYKYKWVKNITR